MKKTPFYDVGLAHGARMAELFGYLLPLEYSTGHEKEHLGTREAASLCDLDYMGEFIVNGPDALALIQRLTTNDFAEKPVGSIRYTAFCDERGQMIDDGTVWRLGEQEYLVVTGDEEDFSWVEENAARFDVSVSNVTREHTTLALQGPKSFEVLGRVTSFDLQSLRYYRFAEADVAGVECIVARMGYTGEFGYELHFHPRHGATMWNELMAAGSEVGIVPVGQNALESLRQEAGYLLVGNDHDKTTNPLEAGIGFTVKFAKGDFNGREALAEIAAQGVERRMVWFDLPSGAVADRGAPILFGDTRIGHVTSSSYSPTRRRGTAMGYVAAPNAIPGLTFTIEDANGRHDATLSVMPLYDASDTMTRQRLPTPA